MWGGGEVLLSQNGEQIGEMQLEVGGDGLRSIFFPSKKEPNLYLREESERRVSWNGGPLLVRITG